MYTNHKMEERLWNYIDGSLSKEERTNIGTLIENDLAWREKYKELMQVNEFLKSSELEAPSMRFTKNVMEEISKLHIAPATKNYINKNIIRGISIFFITIISGFLIYGFGQMDWSSGQESIISKNINKIDFGKLDLSKFFNNNWVNAFMMINIILGLFLLDNYFTNKRKEFRKQA